VKREAVKREKKRERVKSERSSRAVEQQEIPLAVPPLQRGIN